MVQQWHKTQTQSVMRTDYTVMYVHLYFLTLQ